MKLSVIIPCYNAADTIGPQLTALASQDWDEPWEVIVVDNKSTDASMLVVKEYLGQAMNLRIVDASAQQGCPYALNVGARASSGEMLAFCDADDVVGPGWIAAMGRALAQYDFVASRFDTEKLNPLWVQKSHKNPQENGIQKYSYPPFLPHAGGGGLGVKRTLFEAAGGFDESLLILQDTDFCWRLQLMGVELHFVPEAVVYVRYRDSIRALYRQARGYGAYNVLLYKRYRPLGMPKLSWKASARRWMRLLNYLQGVHHKAGRARFMWQFGARVGRLQGSIKHRVMAL